MMIRLVHQIVIGLGWSSAGRIILEGSAGGELLTAFPKTTSILERCFATADSTSIAATSSGVCVPLVAGLFILIWIPCEVVWLGH